MATIPTYISESDLRDVYPNIDKYDTKIRVMGWASHAGSDCVYRAENSGIVNQLFADGQNLDSPQGNVAALNAAPEWYYDSDDDVVYYYNATSNPADLLMESGEDWDAHLTDIIAKASRYFDAYVDRALPRSQWKNESNEFDYIIVRTVAQICAYFLISAHEPTSDDAERLKAEYTDILDKINGGEIKLGFEKSRDSSQGFLREVSVNASSTLKPLDLRGHYSGIYDKIKLKVTKAGSFGVATYSVWVAGNDKLGVNEGSQVITDEIIDGTYQSLSGGIQVRFGGKDKASAATLNDEYEIEVFGYGEARDDARGVMSMSLTRS